MNKRKILITVITGMILVFMQNKNFAQDSNKQKFTLREAQLFAIENNYSVKNARKDIDIARKRIWETTAMGLPQVSGSLSYNNMLDITTMMMPDFLTPAVVGTNVRYGLLDPGVLDSLSFGDPMPVQFGTQHNASYSAVISQLIFNGEYLAGLQGARIYSELSKKGLVKTEMDVKELIAQAYFLVLVAEENKKILQTSYESLLNTLEQTRAMFDEGFMEETDVDQLQLTASNINNTLSTLDRQIGIAYRLLKFQMGLEMEQEIELAENLEDILLQANIEPLIGQPFDINSNIDYQLMKTQEGLIHINLKLQRAAYMPTVAAFFSSQNNAMRNDFDFFDKDKEWFPTTILGFQVQIPIFSSGMRSAKVQQAKMELEKMQNSKLMVADGLNLEVEQSRNDYTSAQEKYLNEKENLELSKRIYEKTLLKFNEGVASSYELTQAQSQYLNTQSNYFTSIFTLLNARSKLEKVLTKN